MTHASLFSGIGGPEVAAEMLGWTNLFHCEINPFGRAVLAYHFPESVSYEDITKTDFTQWRGRVDVLTGGFPCQPFSYAGKRGGADDDRYLWPQMCRAIQECQPTWVVGENVAGLATMVEQCEITELGAQPTLFEAVEAVPESLYEERGRYTIDRICQDLEAIGYAVQPVLIPACGVGACHRRNRIFIIGRRNSRIQQNSHQDTLCMGLQRKDEELGNIKRQRNARTNGSRRHIAKNIGFRTKWTGKGWRPSVSAVHRGNDGLPFNVDDLTIPFAQWRTESLKAYGNAIVPQVMYEIFRAIEEINPIV